VDGAHGGEVVFEKASTNAHTALALYVHHVEAFLGEVVITRILSGPRLPASQKDLKLVSKQSIHLTSPQLGLDYNLHVA
jgi:hypothetical protein